MSAKKYQKRQADSILVVGLGRFGGAVAKTLVEMGKEVLGIDVSGDLVQRWSNEITHVVQADSTDEEALRQLGVATYDRAVVAIGTDIEASVLTVLALSEAGVEEIWAKAITAKHAMILERVGAQHVILPERQMGQRVAHMLAGSMQEYLEFEGGYAMAKIKAPTLMWHVDLGTSNVRQKYRVTVVAVKRVGEDFTYAGLDTIVHENDELIISGRKQDLETFAKLPSTPITV